MDTISNKDLNTFERLIPNIALSNDEINNLLLSSKVDTSKPIEKPPTILSRIEPGAGRYDYKRLFTLGNFSCLIGKAKSKKTFLLSLLTASVIKSNENFISEIPNGKTTVLYFDTEQGDYDCQNTIRRIEILSGNRDILKAFSLRQYTPSQRCSIVEHAFKLWGDVTAFCVIDGVADLATAVNDEEEATRVTSMFLRLTKIHNCHISTVLHQNKNDNFATGWIGSQIMKKAELLISVTKSKNDNSLSDVECEMSRAIDFKPFQIYINADGFPVVGGIIEKESERQIYDNPAPKDILNDGEFTPNDNLSRLYKD